IWLTNSRENLAALQAGEQMTHISAHIFIDDFVYMGGGGATVGLVLVIAIMARQKNASSVTKAMARITLLPGIFNINEPTLFGLPIVLNFELIIPFILTPMVNAIIAYTAMAIGIVPLTTAVD